MFSALWASLCAFWYGLPVVAQVAVKVVATKAVLHTVNYVCKEYFDVDLEETIETLTAAAEGLQILLDLL